jgi:hypothetical protein
MPATPTARSSAHPFDFRSSLGQSVDVLQMLRGGGDERLALDPLTRRDA